MSLKFEISGAQIDGARDYQEDSFLITHLQAGDETGQVSLVIVADGMGGHAAGNVASNLAVQSFNKYVTSHYPSESVPSLLKEAINEANNAIASTIKETSALKGMGCTLVAALLVNNKMYWVSVGDSHLFHIQDKSLTKRNADHSYGGYLDRMAAEGNEVNEENGYSRHMLLSALTGEPIPAIDCPEQAVSIKIGDQILLCSDGIDTLDKESIQARCLNTESAIKLSDGLLTDVSNAQFPRQDNTTVVAVKTLASSAKKDVLPEATLPPIIKSETASVSRKETVAKENTNTVKHARETSHRDRSAKDSSSSSWFLPAVILAAVAAGGWWYMNEKSPVSAPEISYETDNTEMIDENSVSAVTPEIIPETKPGIHEITRFRDKLAKEADAPEMLWIPAGSYEMGGGGSTPPVNERPRHKVKMAEFAISSKEITRGEFALFSGIAVSNTNKNQPVRNVSWKVAKKYVKWLSKQTGKVYRLPSEAEWEYAARARTTSPFWWGYKVGTDNALCFGCGTPLEPTRPKDTGSYAANVFGLFDTAGNVAEWVEDCYRGNYEGAPTDGSVWKSESCKERVLRGGSYVNATKSLYVSRRDKLAGNKSQNNIGFRIVREK